MLRRIVAELLTVPHFRLRLTMHTTPGLRRLDDGRHVVGTGSPLVTAWRRRADGKRDQRDEDRANDDRDNDKDEAALAG